MQDVLCVRLNGKPDPAGRAIEDHQNGVIGQKLQFSICKVGTFEFSQANPGERSNLSSEQKAYQFALWHWKSL